jgi:hypothetical protein
MKMEIYDMESKKYVDFDKVITTYKTFGHLNLHNALEAFNEIPAADVQPTRRGKWEDDWETGCSVCSACGDGYLWEDFKGVAVWNFCPNCGANMREIINE